MSEETFDWRPLARHLAEGWRMIAVAAVVGALVGLLLGVADRARYEATTLLAVTKPELVAQFDDRLAAADVNPAFPYQVATLRAYAELARSEAVALAVAESLGQPTGNSAALLDRIDVQAFADGSLLVLRARGDSARAAAELANAWADALVDRSTDVFAERVGDDALVAQLDRASADLRRAEEQLAGFHRGSLLPARELELEGMQRRYRELLAAADRLAAVQRDLSALRGGADEGGAADLGDRLAALMLQMNTLTAGTNLPVQLNVPGGGVDAGAGRADLDALEGAATAADTALADEMDGIPSQLDRLTSEVEALRTVRTGLERDRKLAEDSYIALARKADEMAVSRAVSGTELQVAAAAVPPSSPSWSGAARALAVGAAFGALAGALLVLLRSHRMGRRATAQEDVA